VTDEDPQDLIARLTPEELAELDSLLQITDQIWTPLPGPQSLAFESKATIIGYGGAAGGGKTDLAIGLSLTKHRKIGIFRQTGTELTAITDRLGDLLGTRDGYNSQANIWRVKRGGVATQIEFGSFPNVGDEAKYRGRPHDLLVFDEAQDMREKAVRFLLGWLRTVDPTLTCQALLTFNPPASAEGRWLLKFFAPWIDRTYEHTRARPGELRWFAMVDGREVEVRNGKPFEHKGETVLPQSRTFIPSKVHDNPYLMGTDYERQLQSLEEPFRSQMLYGDFQAGVEDDEYQVIPTAWVEAAMRRWKPRERKPKMLSLGVDVARGGRDKTIVARRHVDWWFDELLRYSGEQTIDGPKVAGICIAAGRDGAPVHIDVIGVGASPYDFLVQANQNVVAVNVSEKTNGTDRTGALKFKNQRSELWWRMRELLDPKNNNAVELPDDPQLVGDLTTPRWKLVGGVIYVQSREDIVKELGRSPDAATAVILSLIETPSFEAARALAAPRAVKEHDPLRVAYDAMHEADERPREHNPFDYR
jgi:hypothetical protein